MKRKITFLIAAACMLLTMMVTQPMIMVGQSKDPETVASFSRSGSSDTYTSGQSFTTSKVKTNTDNYQENAKADETTYIQLKGTSAYWTTTPTSITLTTKIGAGSAYSLSEYVKVVLLDSSGDPISSTDTNITNTITTTTGDTYTDISIAPVNNVYGVRVYHVKQSGVNIRYYSFTLSYVAGSSDPTITVTPTSLTGFTYSHGNGPSGAQSFTVSGANLTDDLSITAPDDYELRQGTTGDFGNSISLTQSTGTVSSTTIYARLKAGKGIGNYNSENVTLNSTGATEKTVSLSGSVTGYTLTYSGNGNTGGTVPTDATAYEKDASVTILGKGSLVKTHYSFDGWTRNIGGAPKTYAAGDTLIIKANTTVNAVWTPTTHTFNTAINPANSGTVIAKNSSNETVASGSAVAETAQLTLTANPAEGYNFSSWSDGGNNSTLSSTTTNPTTFTMGTANVTVTATFSARTPATVTLNHGEGGNTSTVVNTYADATVADLGSPATVNGWTTMGWVLSYTSGEPELLSTSTVIDDIDDANHELTLYAVYKKGSHTFSKITSTNDLTVDGVYMIAYSNRFMNGASGDYMAYTTGNTIENNSFEYNVGEMFILGGSANAYTLKDGNNYLTATEGYQYLGLLSTNNPTNYSKWSITFSDNTALISNNGHSGADYQHVYLSYHTSNNYFNCYKNTSVVLYKQITNDLQITTAPTAEKCTVTYNANGGTGTVPTDNTQYNIGASVTVAAGTGLTKTGYAFNGWNTEANGSGDAHAAGSTFYINESTILYAQWAIQSYDYTINVTGDDASATAVLKVDDANVAANAKIQYNKEVTVFVTLSDAEDYVYRLSVVNNTTLEPVSVSSNKFNMPASAITVTVTTEDNPYLYAELTGDDMSTMTNKGTGYGTTSTTLKYKTVNGFYWEANAYQQGNTPKYLQINTPGDNTATGSYIKLPVFNGKIEEIVCTVNSNNRYLYFNTTNNTTNTIATGGNGSASTTKTIDMTNVCYQTGYIVSSGSIQITNISVKYRPYQDNAGNTITSIDDDVTVSIPSGSVSATDLTIPASSGLIIKSGATLNVSGTLTNSGNANNLIIEDGGQLITNSSIPLTYKKQITSAAKDGGWYTISTPVHTASNIFLTPGSVENLILDPATNYDFFYYDEASHTWMNYKQSAFNLNIGQGYLYRNNGAELHFAGYNNQATSYNVALSYASTEDKLLGFNLIGNPYPQNITMSDVTVNNGGTLSGGYVLSKDGAWSADVAATIAPAQGFLVQIDKTGVTATITKPTGGSKSRANNDYIKFIVANSQHEDAAFALFEEGYGLNKIDHRNSDIPMLYIPKEGHNFAIATMDDNTQSFNLNLKAKTTGKYTLTYKATGNYSYLHVIDRLTGEDVDMLMEGEYSFIASPSDAENRFIVRLEYSNGYENSEDSIFAYQSGSDIIVNGEGELQIFDVMGRRILTQYVSGVETINLQSHGVCIFKLNEKTQKIVVR